MGQLDQRVGVALVLVPVVVPRGSSGQRLQRGAHDGAADRVEHSVDQQATVLAGGQSEVAILDRVSLLQGVAFGVHRVPVLHALVVELARRHLSRQIEQDKLIEAFAESDCGPRDDAQVGKADLPSLHRLRALGQFAELGADRDPVAGCFLGQVAVEADPVDGGVGALVGPLGALRKLGSDSRVLEQEQVDLALQKDQLLAEIRPRSDHLKHAEIIRTIVRFVK